MIFNFARPFESAKKGGWTSQPECFFVGKITGPLLLRPSGTTVMIGVQFRPHGATQVLGLPMALLNDLAIDLQDQPQQLRREFERIRNLPSQSLSLQALDALMSTMATRNHVDNERLACAVRVIEQSGGLMNIDRVARSVGWTARQLQRRFKDGVGISPKYFA
jgi:AraC-like DNA-binding protein